MLSALEGGPARAPVRASGFCAARLRDVGALAAMAALLSIPSESMAQLRDLAALGEAASRWNSSQAEMLRAQSEQGRIQADQVRARADLVRAQGQAQGEVLRSTAELRERSAQALMHVEAARGTALENAHKGFLYRHECRQIARQARQAECEARVARLREARENLPDEDGLSVAEYDAVSGTLVWPVLLLDDEWRPACREIESLLNPRAAADGRDWRLRRREARRLAAELSAQVKRRVHDSDPAEYADARSFLRRLGHELRLEPSDVEFGAAPTEVERPAERAAMLAAARS